MGRGLRRSAAGTTGMARAAAGPRFENRAAGIIRHLPPLSRTRLMTRTLVFKLLRDVRWGLLCVSLLLCAFQLLWAKVTDRIAAPDQLLASFLQLGLSVEDIRQRIFSGP